MRAFGNPTTASDGMSHIETSQGHLQHLRSDLRILQTPESYLLGTLVMPDGKVIYKVLALNTSYILLAS